MEKGILIFLILGGGLETKEEEEERSKNVVIVDEIFFPLFLFLRFCYELWVEYVLIPSGFFEPILPFG